MWLRALGILWFTAAGLSIAASDVAPGPQEALSEVTVSQIVARMSEMDSQRLDQLRDYRAKRIYVVDNRRFNKHAEMEFREHYAYPGHKSFELLSETGSGYIRRKVIQKMIDAELDSATDGNRDQTKVTPENYVFRLLGSETEDGHNCYVIDVTPKERKKYLIDGRIWVDKQDFAIVRMEGKPAKKPSFWTRSVHFVRQYRKYGSFWLTHLLESRSNVWIAGKSTLKIEFTGYEINVAPLSATETSETSGVMDWYFSNPSFTGGSFGAEGATAAPSSDGGSDAPARATSQPPVVVPEERQARWLNWPSLHPLCFHCLQYGGTL